MGHCDQAFVPGTVFVRVIVTRLLQDRPTKLGDREHDVKVNCHYEPLLALVRTPCVCKHSFDTRTNAPRCGCGGREATERRSHKLNGKFGNFMRRFCETI